MGSLKIAPATSLLQWGSPLQVNTMSKYCPHGSAIGTCMACMGGGGGGGGAAKKSPGLMTWNEAYALWRSIQYSKTLAQDDIRLLQNKQLEATRETGLRQLYAELAVIFSRLTQTALFVASARIVGAVRTIVTQPVKAVVTVMNQILNPVINAIEELHQRFIDVTDKLATLIGEQKKLLTEFCTERLERLKRLIYKNRILKKLVFIWGALDRPFEEFLAHHLDKIKRGFSRLFGRMFQTSG